MRALAPFLFLLFAFLTPSGFENARAAVFNPETFTLDNGMEVVVVPNHRSPVVAHMVWYKVGAADEPPGKSGIAHFLEHLMFKGTESVPPGEFSKIVARHGGRENAFTSQDYTAYFQTVARDRLEMVMKLEADRMTGLKLSDEAVLPERDVVLEERRMRTDNDPASLLGEKMDAALFPGHPYGTPIIGWPDEVSALTTQDAVDFYEKHYAPNNAILIVSGDITAKELKPLAEKYYGTLSPRKVPPREVPPRPEADLKKSSKPQQLSLRDERVRQPVWSRSYRAPSSGVGAREDVYALEILAEILGEGATSRLYRALVVDQALAASSGTSYSPTHLHESSFTLYGVPRQGVALSDIEKSVDAEIAKILEKGISEEELQKAKSRMAASAIYARDGLFGPGRIFGVALTTGGTIEDVESWPEKIAAVSREDVTRAARNLFMGNAPVTGSLLPPDLPSDAPTPAGTDG